MELRHYLLIVLLIWNLIVFSSYGWDKRCALKDHWRIPEKVLLLQAVCCGGVGAGLAMHLFRHKTRKLYFHLVVWLGIGLTIGILYLIWRT